MSETRPRSLRSLFALAIALQVGLGLVLASVYLSSHNTLYNNGNWTPTKTTVAGGLMGAYSYFFDLQALAGNRLALSAWHGYQEVVSKREFDPAAVDFDFRLQDGAHLTFEFNRTEHRFSGIRLSAAERFAPALLRVTVEGEFLAKRPLDKVARAARPRWHHLRVVFEDDGKVEVFLDRRRVRTFRSAVVRPQRIGFRGSMRGVWIDNVQVASREGVLFRDSFSRPGNWRRVHLLAVLGVLLTGATLYLLLRRLLPVTDKHLLFYFLMFSAVLLIVGSLWLGVDWRQRKFYPNATAKLRAREAAHVETGVERMIERIERRHAVAPEPRTVRILFLGSSQTRGSGAARPEHALVRRTERLLDERAGSRRFECLDVAVRGYRIAQMGRDFRKRWIDWSPDVVIVNAGNNDRRLPPREWKQELAKIVEPALGAGIRVVLIPEPNSIEHPLGALGRLHQATREVGAHYGLPVIDMQGYLERRADDGFLWWDWVHLTSFGQRLFAEHLVDELVRLRVVEIPAAPARRAGSARE